MIKCDEQADECPLIHGYFFHPVRIEEQVEFVLIEVAQQAQGDGRNNKRFVGHQYRRVCKELLQESGLFRIQLIAKPDVVKQSDQVLMIADGFLLIFLRGSFLFDQGLQLRVRQVSFHL